MKNFTILAALAAFALGGIPSAQAASLGHTAKPAHVKAAVKTAAAAPACCTGGNCCANGNCCTMPGCCASDGSCCDPKQGACTSACGCPGMSCCAK